MNNSTQPHSVEILKIKKLIFALVITKESEHDEDLKKVLLKNPGFSFKKELMWKIHHLYNEIRQMRSLSIEDIYFTLEVDLEPTDSAKCVHRRNHIKGYREEIAKILTASINQIHKNINRVNICKVAYKIFQSMQAFTNEKPHYIASQWFLGNSPDKNEQMRLAYELYTCASNEQKNCPDFCLKALLNLLQQTRNQVTNTFRTLFLDNILDHIYQWYFVYSESSYEFLIFIPDDFDDIRDYLLDIIDKNPFACYLKYEDSEMLKLTDNECCLEASDLFYLSMSEVDQVSSIRDLTKRFQTFFQNIKDYSLNGAYDYKCYDITQFIPKSALKSRNSKSKIPALLTQLIENKHIQAVLSYETISSDQDTFIRKVIKSDLSKGYILNKTSESLIQQAPCSTKHQ